MWFAERDIIQDPKALEELEALGVMATPATLINGELVVGFDRARLQRLLGEA